MEMLRRSRNCFAVTRISSLAALIGLAAILTVTVATEVRYHGAGRGKGADPPRETDSVAKSRGNDHAPTESADVDAKSILSRPLFATSRRPAIDAPHTISGSHDDELPRLAGIIINESIRPAIFQPKSPEKAIVIGVGDEIGGEKVMAISAREVVIANNNGQRHLRPAPDASLKPEMTPAPGLPTRFVQPANPQSGSIPRPRGGVNFGK
jgi:hypothetical protein